MNGENPRKKALDIIRNQQIDNIKRTSTPMFLNKEQEKEFKCKKHNDQLCGGCNECLMYWKVKKTLKAQRERLSKTFDKTIGTKFEIAENNFKAGQKKQREKFIKVVERKVEAIIANDKTEKYGYSHDARKIYLNANGEKPPVGERWKTPRELAKDILTKLTKE